MRRSEVYVAVNSLRYLQLAPNKALEATPESLAAFSGSGSGALQHYR
ncbi:MAG: hypothetical protein HLUCCA13_11745 [Halomonas sp. HL-48]|nr:hypothetical protein [Halomonas sp. HL-48]KPQ23806.1 MAG: hypothetical protein HLUCCA13_11745 [Halomonas sp. HL-48]